MVYSWLMNKIKVSLGFDYDSSLKKPGAALIYQADAALQYHKHGAKSKYLETIKKYIHERKPAVAVVHYYNKLTDLGDPILSKYHCSSSSRMLDRGHSVTLIRKRYGDLAFRTKLAKDYDGFSFDHWVTKSLFTKECLNVITYTCSENLISDYTKDQDTLNQAIRDAKGALLVLLSFEQTRNDMTPTFMDVNRHIKGLCKLERLTKVNGPVLVEPKTKFHVFTRNVDLGTYDMYVDTIPFYQKIVLTK